MSLRIWNPFMELERMEKSIREAFEPFSGSNFFAPLTDLYETNDGFELHMNVPGIKSKDLHIEGTADFLEIKTEVKEENKSAEESTGDDSSVEDFTPRHIERVNRNYYRKIHFSVPVDPTKAKLTLKDGVLEITIPKRPEAKKIQLKVD